MNMTDEVAEMVKNGEISLDFKSEFNKNMSRLKYITIDFAFDNPENPKNSKMSLLIPNNSKYYEQMIELSKNFVKDNF